MGGEEVEDSGFGEVEAEGFEGDLEFVVVDALVFVQIEKGKLWPRRFNTGPSLHLHGGEKEGEGGAYGLVDLLLLLVGDLRRGASGFSLRSLALQTAWISRRGVRGGAERVAVAVDVVVVVVAIACSVRQLAVEGRGVWSLREGGVCS